MNTCKYICVLVSLYCYKFLLEPYMIHIMAISTLGLLHPPLLSHFSLQSMLHTSNLLAPFLPIPVLPHLLAPQGALSDMVQVFEIFTHPTPQGHNSRSKSPRATHGTLHCSSCTLAHCGRWGTYYCVTPGFHF